MSDALRTETVSAAEWERRFKSYVTRQLVDWPLDKAHLAAQNELDAVADRDASPEDSAAECLSYWGDGT